FLYSVTPRPTTRYTLFPYTTLFRSREIVTLASTVSAPIEVNLFHRTPEREKLIARHLKKFGAKEILGMGSATMTIGGISSPRAKDRKSTRLNSSHVAISYAVFCLKK